MVDESPFDYYKVNQEGRNRIALARADFDTLLVALQGLAPKGRELSIVITKLEEASFFAIKAISKANQE